MTTNDRLMQWLSESSLADEWEASQQAMPGSGLFFLAPEQIAENGALAGLESEAMADLQSAAQRIAADPDLTRLAWHCHYRLFQSNSFARGEARKWPALTDWLDQHAGAFYLIVALSGLPMARAFHKSRHVPQQVARDTYSDTWIWAQDFHAERGEWGLEPWILPWLHHHLCGDLYRLGRLQFVQRPFRQKLRAFRHATTREVMVLSDGGTRYRSDGQLDGTGGEFDTENGWTAELRMDAEQAVGTPIHPRGYALREEVTLALNEWDCILSPNEPILEIHIPAGSRMDFDACGESFRQAMDFFPRYFPDRLFRGFCCTSWLLNTQFEEWLPGDSNIVRFQQEFSLFPIPSGGRSGFDRIFGRKVQDLTDAPRDTHLRRQVLAHLESGGYLRSGGGLLFVEGFDWGRQVYRRP
jgi:hypothetical protein